VAKKRASAKKSNRYILTLTLEQAAEIRHFLSEYWSSLSHKSQTPDKAPPKHHKYLLNNIRKAIKGAGDAKTITIELSNKYPVNYLDKVIRHHFIFLALGGGRLSKKEQESLLGYIKVLEDHLDPEVLQNIHKESTGTH
jgi:hypothetical protein